MTSKREKELFEMLKDGVVNFDSDQVNAAACSILKERKDATRAVFEGLMPGLEEVGRLYERQKYYVPEFLMSAGAMYEGLKILKPHVKGSPLETAGVVVMGVVQGDVHDIGKNLLKMMFDVSGFVVHDLGRDVSPEDFVKEQRRTGAGLVCLSAMMTTSMVLMEDIIKKLKNDNCHVKVMIGGAPVTDEIAERYGAHGYAPDAYNAVKEAIKILKK